MFEATPCFLPLFSPSCTLEQCNWQCCTPKRLPTEASDSQAKTTQKAGTPITSTQTIQNTHRKANGNIKTYKNIRKTQKTLNQPKSLLRTSTSNKKQWNKTNSSTLRRNEKTTNRNRKTAGKKTKKKASPPRPAGAFRVDRFQKLCSNDLYRSSGGTVSGLGGLIGCWWPRRWLTDLFKKIIHLLGFASVFFFYNGASL